MSRHDLEVRRHLVIPAAELREFASRAGGPGGQHLNKASTRVTLRWNVARSAALSPRQRARLLDRLSHRLTRGGDLVVHAGRFRSRHQNRQRARERIAELVREALAVRRRRVATRPAPRAAERRLAEKKRRAEVKRKRGRVRADEP